MSRESRPTNNPPPEPSSGHEPTIGKEGEFVRALNFSGGGFDTVMQLGVAHALLVIQGRAPDVVTGLSAGAIQAAALAEIIQAGESVEKRALNGRSWNELSKEEQKDIQEARLHARVMRLREFAGAVQRAPEEFIDAALPDAHQIDERGHLEPLVRPLDSDRERFERIKMLSGRAGLLRLYNEVLSLKITIGTITRFTRRVLGIIAASEIRGLGERWLARVVEIIRLWILIGQKLPQLSGLVRLTAKTYVTAFYRRVKTGLGRLMQRVSPKLRWSPPGIDRGSNAGTIIFRFPFWNAFLRAITGALAFTFLLISWVSVSWFALRTPYVAISQLGEAPWLGELLTRLPGDQYIYLAYGLPLLALSLSITRGFWKDPATIARVLVSGFILACLLVLWTLVLVCIHAILTPETDRTPLLTQALASSDIDARALWDSFKDQFFPWFYGWTALLGLLAFGVKRTFFRTFLDSHDLKESLLQCHAMTLSLTELFDPDYYGVPDMKEVVAESLKGVDQPSSRGNDTTMREGRRTIGWYDDPDERLEPISLGIAVADVASKRIHEVPRAESLVDAILAATAVVPVFPARRLSHCPAGVFTDAANVTKETSRVLFKMLRHRKHPESRTVHMYNVAPLPFDKTELGTERPKEGEKDRPPPYLNLVDVVQRALSLERFRDAVLERDLIHLYTRTVPEKFSDLVVDVPDGSGGTTSKRFVRAWMTPIELDAPVNLNRRIIGASKRERRNEIARTIADGCRASLQVMICGGPRKTEKICLCSNVVREHLAKRVRNTLSKGDEPNLELADLQPPGGKDEPGPGLAEICRHCRLQECPDTADCGQRLRLRAYKSTGPVWPHEREVLLDFEKGDPHFERENDHHDDLARPTAGDGVDGSQTPSAGAGANAGDRESDLDPVAVDGRQPARGAEGSEPRTRDAASEKREANGRSWPWGPDGDHDRPTISLLFSGGVFRGVYQMGVVNALNMLGVRPNLIAGASVGSIAAAMVASVFSMSSPKDRHTAIANLAGVFLSLDRIILTDRFADFVRDLTIRAAQTEFSIRDADVLFRRYDHGNSMLFTKRVRRVVAGVERLLYINPFQLRDFLRAVSDRDHEAALDQARRYTQQWLDRMQVGKEFLGAEPLRILIDNFVISTLAGDQPGQKDHIPIDVFMDDHRIAFLATATNLTAGRLEVLGGDDCAGCDLQWNKPGLREALLASSAFPSVFRPRWSWELNPSTVVEQQFIDGGVIDNFPIHPVFDYLSRAANSRIAPRPRPVVDGKKISSAHLVIAASLRQDPPVLSIEDGAKLWNFWPSLWKRSGRLKYNAKVDKYRGAEIDLQAIWQHLKRKHSDSIRSHKEPLKTEIVTIKPKWLCGTFAFHPMLGFRRKRQAESIAHGCATTLLQMQRLADERKEPVLKSWGMGLSDRDEAALRDLPRTRKAWRKASRKDGQCWLRPDTTCPFSGGALKDAFEPDFAGVVSEIYTLCQRPQTHAAKPRFRDPKPPDASTA